MVEISMPFSGIVDAKTVKWPLNEHKERILMLQAAIAFFVIGLLAFFFGIYDVAGVSVEIGKLLLVIFLVFALVSFLAALTGNNKSKDKIL